MDAIYAISATATQNQQTVDAYESYISRNMYASDDIDKLESQFNSQIDQLKNTVNQNTTHIANIVHSKYPRPYESDYWHKRECYEILSQYACAHINNMDNAFDGTFSRLNNLFLRLSTWIRNKVTQVYTAVKGFFRGAVIRIRGWFS
jgi:phage-related protein